METKSRHRNLFIRIIIGILNFFKSLVTDRDRRLILLSAILFILAYPPSPLGFLGYFCLVPMLIVVTGKGFKSGFWKGYLFGVIQGAVLLYWVGMGIRSYAASADLEGNLFLEIFLWWIAPVGAPIALAMIHALFLALLFGIYGWITKASTKYIFSFPFIWISVEYLRTISEFAFPWIQLNYTQSLYPVMIQTASWWGDLGIGFWIAILNVLFYLAWKNRKIPKLALTMIGLAIIILAANFIYGKSVYHEETGSPVNVALLQGDISLKAKFSDESLQLSLDRYAEMSATLQGNADLIILPETAVREYLLHGTSWPYLAEIARQEDAYLLVGTFDYTREGKSVCSYNSAVQINPDGIMEYVHHKIRLVPFSEKIPYNEYFPFINDFHFGQSDFCMGDSIQIFHTAYGNYAVMICFEVGFADLNRDAVKKGADFMVTITNDTWWGISAGPYQHAYMVPFRAVENRRWYARCANSGFSFVCDPEGRIDDLGPLFKQVVIEKTIYTNDRFTFYTKHGLWLPKLILLFTFLLILNRFIGNYVKRVR